MQTSPVAEQLYIITHSQREIESSRIMSSFTFVSQEANVS